MRLPDGVSQCDLPGVQVLCLSDGETRFGAEVFPSVGDDLRAARLADAGLGGIDTEFNAYVLRHADGAIDLVDTGYGALQGDKAGHLAGHLRALGIDPGAVRHVIFTHLHGDHCGGALRDGQRVFANAGIVLHRDERAFWAGRDAPGGRVIEAYGDRLREVTEGERIVPGVTCWALPGHTPGHMGLRVEGGLVLGADIVHSAALQLPDPEVATVYDSDTDQARATRKAALAEIADKGLIWAGSHAVGGQKFVRLDAVGSGYRARAI